MRSLAEVAGQELVWVQPAATRQNFELRAGDDVVATLRFQRGSLAEAEASDGRWTFKREGFWHPRVTVRVPGSDANVAAFNPRWAGGGTLEIDNRILQFAAANFWHSQWDWQGPDGKPLVHFKSRHGLVRVEGQVELPAPAGEQADLPLLVLLGWYLLILHARDSAVAASTAAVVATHG